MKNITDNKVRRSWLAALTISLLLMWLSACAPPPSTSPGQNNELALLKQQQQQQQQTLLAIQQQLRQLQQQVGVQAPTSIVPTPGETSFTTESQVEELQVTDTAEVQNLVEAAGIYLEAFSALSLGQYEQAQNGFSTFLEKFSDHRYAPNARYWLAETEITLGLLNEAEENLLLVVNDHVSDDKAPAALFQLAKLYQQQNLTQQADDILHQLRTRFPESREAQHFNRSNQAQ